MTESTQTGSKSMVTLDGTGPELTAVENVPASKVRLELLMSRYQSLAKELSSANDSLKAERQKNERLTASLLKLQGESIAYRTLLDRQQHSTDQVLALARRMHGFSDEMGSAQTGGREANALISAYQRTAQESSESLRLVTSSLAWRVTRPLRWVRRIMIARLGM